MIFHGGIDLDRLAFPDEPRGRSAFEDMSPSNGVSTVSSPEPEKTWTVPSGDVHLLARANGS